MLGQEHHQEHHQEHQVTWVVLPMQGKRKKAERVAQRRAVGGVLKVLMIAVAIVEAYRRRLNLTRTPAIFEA